MERAKMKSLTDTFSQCFWKAFFEQIALFEHIILYHFHMKWPAYHGIPPMFRHTRIFAFFWKRET